MGFFRAYQGRCFLLHRPAFPLHLARVFILQSKSLPFFIPKPTFNDAEVFLQYINFRCVRELSPAPGRAPSGHSLVDYASCYWGKRTRRESAESATQLALQHPVGFEERISSKLLSPDYYRDIIYTLWTWSHAGFSLEHFMGPHSAVISGMGEIVSTLLAMN